MRELKFKFYDTLMNQWATDWLAINDKRLVADNEGKEFVDVPDVDRFIPCQYTGLLDKNGVEIYEGDVLRSISEIIRPFDISNERTGRMSTKLSVVQYRETDGAFCNSGSALLGLNQKVISKYCEVIGNINEATELLEDSHD